MKRKLEICNSKPETSSRLTFDTDAAFYLQATRLSSYGQITIDKC